MVTLGITREDSHLWIPLEKDIELVEVSKVEHDREVARAHCQLFEQIHELYALVSVL